MELALSGTTLKVYMLLLSDGPMGVREVQRKMGFRSPSTASYHLKKLVYMGLARQRDDGLYEAVISKNSVLSLYVSIAGRLIPRLILLASFSLGCLAAYFVLYYPNLDPVTTFFAVLAVVPPLIEGLRLYRVLKGILGG